MAARRSPSTCPADSQRHPSRLTGPWTTLPRMTQVEILVPVYNEQAGLSRSIHRLHSYLSASFPLSWRIVIADNASVDGTLEVARSLMRELTGVEVLHLDAKGRGRALRAAW